MKRDQLLITVLLLSGLTSACGKSEGTAKANNPPPSAVQVQTLQNDTLQESTEYVGTLEAEQRVDLKPQIDGRIDQILVKPGERVNQGETIFTLSLDQTASQVTSAQANTNAEIAARNTATQQLQVARSQLAAAQSQYELAKVNNDRYQYLANEGATQRATADQYATDLKVKRDTVKQAQDQIKAAQAGLNQADANVRKAQADTETARVSLDFKKVVAPISGAVGNITLKSGDYVTTGQTLTTINRNNAFDLQIPIPLSRAGQVRTGLTVDLLDPNTGKQLSTGKIYFVSSQADSASQVLLTRARFSNDSGKLRDSQYVRARVIWKTSPGVLVPTTAVTTIGGQSFVFVAEEQTKNGKQQTVAHQVPITLGSIQGQSYQVVKGLKSGDRVITSGILRLRDGSSVAPQQGSEPKQTTSANLLRRSIA
ncbi:MAG: efflux RND transporter periplasmic adaptor subunit [Kovacikia sp.]